MAVMKSACIALAAMLLTFPAMAANDCYSQNARGGVDNDDKSASRVRVMFNNASDTEITAYATDRDGVLTKYILAAGETKRSFMNVSGKRRTSLIQLDYLTQSGTRLSKTRIVDIEIENSTTSNASGSRFRKTRYIPAGTKRENIKCHRTWRKKNRRWDIDVTFE